MEPDKDNNSKNGSKAPIFIGGFVVGGIIAAVIVFFLLIGPVMGGIAMGEAMTDMRVLGYISNQDNSVVAYAISDDCGATCGCATRVDIDIDGEYYREAFRSYDACELILNWIDQETIEISFPDYYDLDPEYININNLE